MGLRNGADHIVAQKLRRVSSASQGIPALNDDPLFLDKGNHVLLLIVRMYLILYQSRHGRHLRQELRQFLHIPVGETK